MGAHSTLYITERTARAALLKKILESSTAEVEDMLSDILYGDLYNCMVSDFESREEDDSIVRNLFGV